MITEPTQASKEAMQAKTQAVPPKERTTIDPLPSGGTAGQVLTKTSDGAQWADVPQELPDLEGSDAGDVLTNIGNNKTAWVANHDIPSGGTTGQVLTKMSGDNYATGWKNVPAAPLLKSTSTINRVRIKVDTDDIFPSTVGDDASITITSVTMPSARDELFMSQYEEGEYFDGLLGVEIVYIDPEDPDEVPVILAAENLIPFNIRCTYDDEIELEFKQFYMVRYEQLYRISIPGIERSGNNQWTANGSDVYIECLMGSAQV